ncbi:hypothetical protein B0H15DRAFT_863216 [Mycena belliarum]|uniref:Uncharacterized protein n=1 Tax=Mycena belliarum TaxID=1033014 RepID=A0AAD6XK52_9AGAR|nr:hypothetical protein B0H15DRAFT_863216 [Mycena belliae]
MPPRPLPVPPRTHHAHTAPSHLNTTGPTHEPHGRASSATPFFLYRSTQRDSATLFLLPRRADRDAHTHSSSSSSSSTSSSSSSSSSRSRSSVSTRSSLLPTGPRSSYPPSPRSPRPPAYAEPAASWKERAYIPSATVVPALLAALAPAPRARTASTASSHSRDWSDLPASSHVHPASYGRAESRSSTRTRTRSSDFGVPRDARTPSPAPSHASYSRAPSRSSDFDARADACSCNRDLLYACQCSDTRRRNATYRRERGWSGEWVGVGMGRDMEMADVVSGLRALRAG